MEGKNGGVTERAVYWPRKCSQAAGQSAWLVPPSVTNSPLADESRPLFAVSINGSLHQRRAVYLPVHRPHTQLPLVLRLPPTLHPSRLLVFLPLSLSLSLSLLLQFVSLSPPQKRRTNNKKAPGSANVECHSSWFWPDSAAAAASDTNATRGDLQHTASRMNTHTPVRQE